MRAHLGPLAPVITVLITMSACAAPDASPRAPAQTGSMAGNAAESHAVEAGMELVSVAADGLVLESLIEVDGGEPPGSPEIGAPVVVIQRTDDALLVLPAGASGGSAAWVAAETEDGHPTVEPLQPACPGEDPTIADLIALGVLARFCGLSVAFDGYVPEFCGTGGGTVGVVNATPEWLYGDGPSLWVYAEQPADPFDQANPPESGVLAARVPPAIPVVNCDPERARRWYAFSAHFDDPAAATCRATWADRSGLVSEPPAVAEAACRLILVIDSARPIPAP